MFYCAVRPNNYFRNLTLHSLASELRSNDRLGGEGEFYRNVDQRVFGDRPRAGWIVQYNVISYLHYMASLYTLTNMVLRTFVSCRKLSSCLGGSDIVDAH